MELNDFNYDLPEDKIALYPLENRDLCKLLVFNKRQITHSFFNEIDNFLPSASLLIINSSKVLPARILAKKITGGLVEFLLLSPKSLDFDLKDKNFDLENGNFDYEIGLSSRGNSIWECIIGGRNVKIGDKFEISSDKIEVSSDKIEVTIEILDRYENKAVVRFIWAEESLSFGEILEIIGVVPLPPYIRRAVTAKDRRDYQTIYANISGSIAAPTAGLHFTDEVLFNLSRKNIKISELILHVGAGTFVPIAKNISEHQMHSEKLQISFETVSNLLSQYSKNGSVIATGTTSLRTLESLYLFGVQLIKKETNFKEYNSNFGFHISQEDSYISNNISVFDAFSELFDFMVANNLMNVCGSTEIFIVPGYKIRTIGGLITNFHLPKSTLLLLISSFIGIDNVRRIYSEALGNNYKFLSYGDASLLLK